MQRIPALNTKAYNFVPHSPQNRVPGAFWVPQDGQSPCGLAGWAFNGVPHSPQNFTLWLFLEPQFGQTLRAMEAPQLLQNLPLPAGFPQTGQMVVLLSISPLQTVAVWLASSIFRFIASALALAT